jgi:rhodanese-related sulfurtransferase
MEMKKLMATRGWSAVALLLQLLLVSTGRGQAAPNIYTATLGESGTKTPEISTKEFRHILVEKNAMVFDVRPAMEFATSHIPGAVNVAQKPGTSKALYVSDVAEISRLLGDDKGKPVVLYCNGPFCGKSKRVSEDLLAAGFTNVRRYQLGIPVWRALGGVTQIEPEGARYVMQNDHTTVWLDTRPAQDMAKAPLPGAKRIGVEVARGGKDNAAIQQAKNDGTLPIEDHNTRIIVFGDDPQTVRSVAEAIGKEAFHNVAFFGGNAADLARAVK